MNEQYLTIDQAAKRAQMAREPTVKGWIFGPLGVHYDVLGGWTITHLKRQNEWKQNATPLQPVL